MLKCSDENTEFVCVPYYDGDSVVRFTIANARTASLAAEVQEDEVDKQLKLMDGWIKPTGPTKCTHGPNGRCGACMPIAVSSFVILLWSCMMIRLMV